MLASLAIVSGCMSLNKGSNQVALAPGKEEAQNQMPPPAVAKLPAATVAAKPTATDVARAVPRREADLTAEVRPASLSPGADLPGERAATRVVRAAPPEPTRPQPTVPSSEQTATSAATARTETVAQRDAEPPAANSTEPSDVKLPTIINGAAALAPTVRVAATEPPAARLSATTVRTVNSKRISLNYEIKDIGPSGVSTVELWYTQDGKKWDKSDTLSKPRPPFLVDLKDEGLYGLTLLARNGVGLGKRPPAPGDQPQIWVEVDTTKPVAKLVDI